MHVVASASQLPKRECRPSAHIMSTHGHTSVLHGSNEHRLFADKLRWSLGVLPSLLHNYNAHCAQRSHACAQVEPELLHLLLELDSRRSLSPPAVRVCADASGGWTLEGSSPEHAEAESMHASSAGEPSGASKPGAQGASGRADAEQSPTAGPAAASGNATTACSGENGWHGKQQNSQQSNGHGTSAGSASAKAARSSKGTAQKQQKAPEHAAGSEAGLPMVTCGLEDVSMLLAHGEKDRPEWRAVVSSAAKALQKAVQDSNAFEPGSTEELMVRSHLQALQALT